MNHLEKTMLQGDRRPNRHTCDYLQPWAYHGGKVKAILDNGTIMGIILEPLRLQKGFVCEANYAACLPPHLHHNFVSVT